MDEINAGTLTMNHMTITKMYTLESDEIVDVDKQNDMLSNLSNDSALKRVLRIGTVILGKLI
jgi:magnesium-transporting ATPase (P-type)